MIRDQDVFVRHSTPEERSMIRPHATSRYVAPGCKEQQLIFLRNSPTTISSTTISFLHILNDSRHGTYGSYSRSEPTPFLLKPFILPSVAVSFGPSQAGLQPSHLVCARRPWTSSACRASGAKRAPAPPLNLTAGFLGICCCCCCCRTEATAAPTSCSTEKVPVHPIPPVFTSGEHSASRNATGLHISSS